jgi:hypothetical protein
MVYSKQTNQVRISNQSSPRNSTIDTFLIHHQAGTNDDAVIAAMVSGSRGVSANYTISNEGRLTCVVPEERRAWTSGSAYDGGKGAAWDHRAVTVEIENESGAPNWGISDKAFAAAARLLVDLRERYTIRHVLGHRDLWNNYGASYATFCPGPNTVAKILAIANSSSSSASSNLTPFPKSEETMYILKNKNDTSTASSHFIWGAGITPRIINNSTVEIYKDAGVEVHETTRERWLWLYEDEAKRAKTSTPTPVGAEVVVNLKPVIDAVAAIPAAVRANLIRE